MSEILAIITHGSTKNITYLSLDHNFQRNKVEKQEINYGLIQQKYFLVL